MRHFLREMGAEGMRPGDVLITNNPWMGTGHLSDVCVVKPIFRDGRLVAFSATTSHMPDIGGRIRAIEAREVFEEGVHIPLAKFVREGQPDETLIQLLRANVRTPDQTLGDIWAQVSANELMDRRVLPAPGGVPARRARPTSPTSCSGAPSAPCARPSRRCPTGRIATPCTPTGSTSR